MAINFNPNIASIYNNTNKTIEKPQNSNESAANFNNSIKGALENVNESQNQSDASIKDLLTGKSQDINSVVAAVAKADTSFNMLVGVRNKLIEAYKETMRMQV